MLFLLILFLLTGLVAGKPWGDLYTSNSPLLGGTNHPICLQCCKPGQYRHGNELCGLAVDTHSFAFELVSRLGGNRNDNIVVSPFSVTNILMMLSLGAAGVTQREIREVLRFPNYFQQHHEHVLMKCALARYVGGVSLKTANAIFYENTLTSSKNSFIEEAKKYYNISVEGVSFHGDPMAAWRRVSEFIQQSTDGYLDTVMQEVLVSELVFINTIHFAGTWGFDVPANSLREVEFLKYYRKKKVVRGFTVTGWFSTGLLEAYEWYGDKIRVVELPYSDEAFSMFIIKPEQGMLSLNFIEDIIRAKTIRHIKYHNMNKQLINLTVPKFSISYQGDIAATLNEMGIKTLFSKQKANLTDMFQEHQVLATDGLIHSAKITVNEEGTEAAAASISILSRAFRTVDDIAFCHPFVFVIYDNCNNIILFQGRVHDP